MLIRVDGLRTHFHQEEGIVRAVDGISFEIDRGEAVALVGESGCGKTIVARSLIGLVPPPGRIVGGKVLFRGDDLMTMSRERLRELRGEEIGMIFQEPGAALNPVFTIGDQIREVLRSHRGWSRSRADRAAVRHLDEVGIPEPDKRVDAFPHELSGGLQQRAMIAIATCTRPSLLIADEPTTALDVTVQAEILRLLDDLRERHDMALLLITHDLTVVAQAARRLMVMYAGKLVEKGPVDEVLKAPRHPYSKALVSSVPELGEGAEEPLEGIPGSPPDPLDRPRGCSFHPRCPIGDDGCTDEFPPMRGVDPARDVACYKVGDGS